MATALQTQSKKKVCYYYDNDIGNYFYGEGHLMKPHRIRMTHNLILNYGIYRFMKILTPPKTSSVEMTKFHADSYIKLLRVIRPDNMSKYARRMERFNVGGDCPVFEGLYEFCQLSSGGSIAAAAQLNKRNTDICINWSGGLHHAKKARASGFCYVNDVVLAILELLKSYHRVLYVDIDVHHGDGVEEAFYMTDRVMTVSFHKFGEEYFPGTGALSDIGVDKGKYYAINVPLNDGMDDESYENIFVPIMSRVIESYQPNALVLQCGADSLTGDRLGCFNLTIRGHGKCVEFIKKFNLPLLMLGGGGYTLRNVARLWTYETSIALGVEIVNDIPYNDYLEYYAPDYKLHSSASNMINENTKKYLQGLKERVIENIRMLPHAPGVQIQPTSSYNLFDDSDDEDDLDKDLRISERDRYNRIVLDTELSDSDEEDEEDGGRRDNFSFRDRFQVYNDANIDIGLNKVDLKFFDTQLRRCKNLLFPGKTNDKKDGGKSKLFSQLEGTVNCLEYHSTVASESAPISLTHGSDTTSSQTSKIKEEKSINLTDATDLDAAEEKLIKGESEVLAGDTIGVVYKNKE